MSEYVICDMSRICDIISPMNICIFCKNRTSKNTPPEHIIPESLGCPSEFVLRKSEVCQCCNNTVLAHLDAELNDTFGLFKISSVPRNKKGKSSSVLVSNFYAENKKGHINIHLNFYNKPVRLLNGKILCPMRKSSYAIKDKFHIVGSMAEINFVSPLVRLKKTIRGLYKIAFGALCYFKGHEYVLDPIFDEARNFIISGTGKKTLLIKRVA